MVSCTCKAAGNLLFSQGRLFGLCKPFFVAGDCKIIRAGRPVKVVHLGLIFRAISTIILSLLSNQ